MDLLELHGPEETLRMCNDSPAFRKICDDPVFRKNYIEENRDATRAFLESNPLQYPEWVQSGIEVGLFTLDFSVGFACLTMDMKLLDKLMIQQNDIKQFYSYLTTFALQSTLLMERFLKWTKIKIKDQQRYEAVVSVLHTFAIKNLNYDVLQYLVSQFPIVKVDAALLRILLPLKDKHLNILKLIPIQKYDYDEIMYILIEYLTNNRYELFNYIINNVKWNGKKLAELKAYIAKLVIGHKVILNRQMLEIIYGFIKMSEEDLLKHFLVTQTNINWVLSKMTKIENVYQVLKAPTLFSDVSEPYHAFFARLDELGAPDDPRVPDFINGIPIKVAKELLRYETFTKNASVNRLFLLRYG